MTAPLIGITADRENDKYAQGVSYAAAVASAGGIPLILPHTITALDRYIALCDAFILTGGDDPIMEEWGIATHPLAKKIDPHRQSFELALLRALAADEALRRKPVLGICLGMQLMALEAGGTLDQHLPESSPAAAARHWGGKPHAVAGDLGSGTVLSHHRQVVIDPGRMRICAAADDGIIEAVVDDDRPFYLGVQWHPERTNDPSFGVGVFQQLVIAAQSRTAVV